MPQPSESSLSSSPLNWDGKCQTCRKLMSRCVCFQELEGDARPLHTAASYVCLLVHCQRIRQCSTTR